MLPWNSKFYHPLRLLRIYIVTFYIFIPYICLDLPFSKLFYLHNKENTVLQKAVLLNQKRVNQSNVYFSSLHPQSSLKFYYAMRTELDLVVSIITVRRKENNLGYLTQAAAQADKLLKEDTIFKKKFLFICNVDKFPDHHTEAINISKYIPIFYRYSNQTLPLRSNHTALYQMRFHQNHYQKETIDYMFCLETALQMNPKYVLMMEDDSLPLQTSLSVLDFKLQYLNRAKQTRSIKYAYIKLYYPPKWQGYATELRRIIDIISVGMVGSGCFVILFAIKQRNNSVKTLYFVSGAIYFILCALVLGRQNVSELRRFSRQLYTLDTSPGCCTQAMFYPRWVIPHLVDFLGRNDILNRHHTDIAIYNFITSNNLTAYYIEPNLFYHIGMYTSIHEGGHKDPQEFIFQL